MKNGFSAVFMALILVFTTSLFTSGISANDRTALTEAQAEEIVLEHVPNGTVESCELALDHGVIVYRIDVVDGHTRYEFFINATNGIIEAFTKEEVMSIEELNNNRMDISKFIGDEAAKSIALQNAGGGNVTKCKLTYNGIAEYEVHVLNGTTTHIYIIDAFTGNVDSSERESTPQSTEDLTVIEYPVDTPTVTTQAVQQTAVTPIVQTTAYSQSQSDASAIALSRIGGGTVARVETHTSKRNGTEYKVIIVNGNNKHCVHVNASSGIITNQHLELIDQVGKSNPTSAISAEQAKSIAIQNAGGNGVVTKCKLEYKKREGTSVYSIKVAVGQTEHTMEIDSITGNVVKTSSKQK